MNLSPHFTFKELTHTNRDIYNIPDPVTARALATLAANLEKVRAVVGPMAITSGYRSPALNDAIGGSRTSDHVKGLAVDFSVRGKLADAVRKIRDSKVEYDQLILEPTWIHIGFGPRMRRQTLTAIRDPENPRKFKYVKFV